MPDPGQFATNGAFEVRQAIPTGSSYASDCADPTLLWKTVWRGQQGCAIDWNVNHNFKQTVARAIFEIRFTQEANRSKLIDDAVDYWKQTIALAQELQPQNLPREEVVRRARALPFDKRLWIVQDIVETIEWERHISYIHKPVTGSFTRTVRDVVEVFQKDRSPWLDLHYQGDVCDVLRRLSVTRVGVLSVARFSPTDAVKNNTKQYLGFISNTDMLSGAIDMRTTSDTFRDMSDEARDSSKSWTPEYLSKVPTYHGPDFDPILAPTTYMIKYDITEPVCWYRK